MEIQPFVDEYELVSPLFGVSADTLRERDLAQHEPPYRIMAFDGHRVAGALTAAIRPDNRTFLRPVGEGSMDLVRRALVDLPGPVHIRLGEPGRGELATYEALGFRVEMIEETFQLRFESVLAALRRHGLPDGYDIVPVEACDPDRLFELDNELRNYVPGINGWKGDRTWFDDELVDPAAYFVAVERSTSKLVGLVRIWSNPTGPHFGLIGVLPSHRRSRIAIPLLYRGVATASRWGSPAFVASTSLSNPIHRWVQKRSDASLGKSFQLVRP